MYRDIVKIVVKDEKYQCLYLKLKNICELKREGKWRFWREIFFKKNLSYILRWILEWGINYILTHVPALNLTIRLKMST